MRRPVPLTDGDTDMELAVRIAVSENPTWTPEEAARRIDSELLPSVAGFHLAAAARDIAIAYRYGLGRYAFMFMYLVHTPCNPSPCAEHAVIPAAYHLLLMAAVPRPLVVATLVPLCILRDYPTDHVERVLTATRETIELHRTGIPAELLLALLGAHDTYKEPRA